MTRPSVLVVDDKPTIVGLLVKVLGKLAHVSVARGASEAIAAVERRRFSAIVCDLRMPDGDGLEVLRAVQSRAPGTPFVLMTAYGSIATAVQATREGAFDYVTKPFDPDDLRAVVARALAMSPGLRPAVDGRDRLGQLLGGSPKMRELYDAIERVAATDATVFVFGETGTGKDLVARALHERSARRDRSFFSVSCVATPHGTLENELFGYAKGAFPGASIDRAGLLETAEGGTLLLDDVSGLRGSVQARLARALEHRAIRRSGEARERPIDVRIIVTSRDSLVDSVRRDQIREDLALRLRVAPLELPPLRAREGDVPVLARHFVAELGPGSGGRARSFSAEALARLDGYGWPGNVRELRTVVETASLADGPAAIGLAQLPAEIRLGPRPEPEDKVTSELTFREAIDHASSAAARRYLEAVLVAYEGDVVLAAAHAGMGRESFYRLLRRFALVPGLFRQRDE